MIAYISESADKRILSALKQDGYEVIPLAPFSVLSNPVSTHTDMLILAIGDIAFVHIDYRAELKGFKEIIRIDEQMSDKYPHDVLLNIAVVGKNVFCNTKFASVTVLEYLKSKGYFIHHVSQGYTHCSVCIVDDNAIITSDIGISQSAKNAGIDVLKISEGDISLPPYNYGFIGGTSGSHKEKIFFCGSLECHPDGEKIRDFCKKHSKIIVELTDTPLMDVGGILFI